MENNSEQPLSTIMNKILRQSFTAGSQPRHGYYFVTTRKLGWFCLAVCLWSIPVFSQARSETVTENYGVGAKKITTYTDTEAGEHIINTEVRIKNNGRLLEKSIYTANENGVRLEVEHYEHDAKGNVRTRDRSVYYNNQRVVRQMEVYEDGVTTAGCLSEPSETEGSLSDTVQSSQQYKIFNTQTGSYQVTDYETFTRFQQSIFRRDYGRSRPKLMEIRNASTTWRQWLESGVYTSEYQASYGKIDFKLPDLIAPNENVTGTVNVQPNGKTPEEKAKNEAELKKFKFQFPDGTQLDVLPNLQFHFLTPTSQTGGDANVYLLKDNKLVSLLPLDLFDSLPRERSIRIPTGGQQGRPLVLTGPFDGLVTSNDFVKIGDKPTPIIAESARERVILNNSEDVGLTKIVWSEAGKISECPFRSIGIKLSADNLNLLRGQTTTLHVQVVGLAGISKEVSLALTNDSPAIISLSGGNQQLLKISPLMVNADGTFNLNQTITGVVTGGFGITGTVRWKETCSGK